ncbi:M1 family metallopeptidase [Pararhodonellum marinum]|uniref:M1 family metallopeptidase n=1 Tax=Pararhodonellum marinum TaxID=2755358 RepID=UPI001890738D|nr:M1 family metallopeptidase [Pararhodonellum marinum]
MKLPLTFLFICFYFIASAQTQEAWTWGGPIDPLQTKFRVLHYQLDLEIIPESHEISGVVKVTFEAPEKLDTLRLNLISDYQVERVIMDGEKVNFLHMGEILDIYPMDCTCEEVIIYYSGSTPIAPNPPWVGGFTWEMDEFDNHWMGLSSQNEGAKIFMPCLDHPSSEPINGVDLYLTAPKPYFVASNGRLVRTEEKGDNITYHWSTQYPINNYNINFTLGIFHEEKTTFTSVDGTEIPMMVYVLQENRDKAKALLSVLENSTRTHEKYFGPFPFAKDKIAVVETPYLGMEHQTINAYGNNFQFVPMGSVQYDWLLHHELGHEWFGNKVSVKDWADFWIHEGLTAYGDFLFYLEHGGESAYVDKVHATMRQIINEKPVVSPVNSTSDEAYHPEIYTKGAVIMHSLRFYLGDEVFFPMVKAFANDDRFTYENFVTTRDFIGFVQTFSNQDLEGFFDLYLYTTKLPKVKISKKGKKGYNISLRNVDFMLPMEVETSEGIKRVTLSKAPTFVDSKSPVVVDPNMWYLLDR